MKQEKQFIIPVALFVFYLFVATRAMIDIYGYWVANPGFKEISVEFAIASVSLFAAGFFLGKSIELWD